MNIEPLIKSVALMVFLFSIAIFMHSSYKAFDILTSLLTSLLIIVPHYLFMYLYANKKDCTISFKFDGKLAIISLFVSLFFPFILPYGYVEIKEKEYREMKYKYGLTLKERGEIVVIGNLINLIIAIFLYRYGDFFYNLSFWSLIYVIANLIPVPKFEGSIILSFSFIYFFYFLFASIISLILVLLKSPLLLTLIFNFLLAIITFILVNLKLK